MKGQIVSTAEAAAHAARISGAGLVCTYSAPFSESIIQKIKEIPVLESDSFSTALNSAIGAEMGGKRAFIASSGIMANEDMHVASQMRIPLVLFNVSRAIGSFSMKYDHSDIMSMRDSGWLIFLPENNQEIMDMTVQAYKVCEDPKVLLPGIVAADMAHFTELVQVPSDKFTTRFISKFHSNFQFGKKQFVNVPDQEYSELRKQQHRGMKNAIEVLSKTSVDWKKKMGRTLGVIESYKLDDADYAIIIAGFHSTTAKAAVERMRADGKKVGLLRIKVLRPLPADAIRNALKNVKKAAVFDQSMSLGQHGLLFSELSAFVRASDFVSMGMYPSEKDFIEIIQRLMDVEKEELVWL